MFLSDYMLSSFILVTFGAVQCSKTTEQIDGSSCDQNSAKESIFWSINISIIELGIVEDIALSRATSSDNGKIESRFPKWNVGRIISVINHAQQMTIRYRYD